MISCIRTNRNFGGVAFVVRSIRSKEDGKFFDVVELNRVGDGSDRTIIDIAGDAATKLEATCASNRTVGSS